MKLDQRQMRTRGPLNQNPQGHEVSPSVCDERPSRSKGRDRARPKEFDPYCQPRFAIKAIFWSDGTPVSAVSEVLTGPHRGPSGDRRILVVDRVKSVSVPHQISCVVTCWHHSVPLRRTSLTHFRLRLLLTSLALIANVHPRDDHRWGGSHPSRDSVLRSLIRRAYGAAM